MRLSRGGKITVMALAGAAIALTPLYWLLDNPDTGQLVAASIQGATGVLALVWALLATPSTSQPGTDSADNTGKAMATDGGRASTGVRRPRGAEGGSAKATRTGDASADGSGSSASTGVDYS